MLGKKRCSVLQTILADNLAHQVHVSISDAGSCGVLRVHTPQLLANLPPQGPECPVAVFPRQGRQWILMGTGAAAADTM